MAALVEVKYIQRCVMRVNVLKGRVRHTGGHVWCYDGLQSGIQKIWQLYHKEDGLHMAADELRELTKPIDRVNDVHKFNM